MQLGIDRAALGERKLSEEVSFREGYPSDGLAKEAEGKLTLRQLRVDMS